MINSTLPTYTTPTPTIRSVSTETSDTIVQPSNLESSNFDLVQPISAQKAKQQTWWAFGAAVFLVSVPVFIEAPLVRSLPLLSLGITLIWVWLSLVLMSRPSSHLWGDILLGFSWSWLAGSIYWGWLRWEPLLHLPVEAIGLPFAIVCLRRNWGKVGNFFYLGSLLGTVVTDLYFYIADLIPYWRQVVQVEPTLVAPILRSALAQVYTPWGLSWAAVLVLVLLAGGVFSLRARQTHWWAFSGAVLSTILVDSLFWLAAALA
ncbi:DUF3120 domain-containing protein [Scytonema millei]|uniref:DUF3120 domain-containing protein n=1 Tax=Scytonema millei VB511283 TaxID=1245923 RepID=A0A9X5E795_9CYAN|nr:DUF3120 domain-containing protein [Scytonema millei]NHC36216.1 DUF3120 domain-containing protein [Scytonema millei VB511283]